MTAARDIVQHPRIKVTDIEARIGTRFTAQTLKHLKQHARGVHFVWLMGADNLAQFHRWQDWEWIMQNVPIGVLARPGDRLSARMSKAARVYRHAKLPARAATMLGRSETPAWCFINLPMSSQSSTAIRAGGGWRKTG